LKSLKGIKVDGNDLAAFCRDFISFLITTEYQVGNMPEQHRQNWVKDLAAQFTHTSNANKNFKGNREFQKDLNAVLLADEGFGQRATVKQLRKHAQSVINTRARNIHWLGQRTSGEKRPVSATSTSVIGDKSKKPKPSDNKSRFEFPLKSTVGAHCEGCGREGH